MAVAEQVFSFYRALDLYQQGGGATITPIHEPLQQIQNTLAEKTGHMLPARLLDTLGMRDLTFTLAYDPDKQERRSPYMWLGSERREFPKLKDTVAVIELSEHLFAIKVAGKDVLHTNRPVGLKFDANDLSVNAIQVGLTRDEDEITSGDGYSSMKLSLPTHVEGGRENHFAAAFITRGMTEGDYPSSLLVRRGQGGYRVLDLGEFGGVNTYFTGIGDAKPFEHELPETFDKGAVNIIFHYQPPQSFQERSWSVAMPAFLERVFSTVAP